MLDKLFKLKNIMINKIIFCKYMMSKNNMKLLVLIVIPKEEIVFQLLFKIKRHYNIFYYIKL